MTPDAQRVAYHEAAHVLVARQLGRRIDSVSLNLDGGGTTRGFPLARDASPEEVERALTVVLAGKFAERYAPRTEPKVRAWTDDPWLTTGEMAAAAAATDDRPRVSDDDVVAHWEARIGSEAVARARALAEELVDREAEIGRLARLANELASRVHLTADEITTILEGGNHVRPI